LAARHEAPIEAIERALREMPLAIKSLTLSPGGTTTSRACKCC
jgi:hypothetical protein